MLKKLMWVLWAFLAAISAACVIVLTKAGLKEVDPNVAFAIQAVFIFAITWTVIGFQGKVPELRQLDNKTWMLLVGAGIATTLSTIFSFKALSLGQATGVTTIERSSLVFAIILSIIFLKEKITWQLVVGAILVLSGAMLISLSKSE
jgi:transporter family protein